MVRSYDDRVIMILEVSCLKKLDSSKTFITVEMV